MMNLSKITEYLYIGTTPKVKDYDLLRQLGIDLVINMRFRFPPVADLFITPMKSLWLPVIDSPLFPIPIIALKKGTEAALKSIENGGIVLSHCARGRHRSVALGACILFAQGMPIEDAMKLIKEKRPVADPYIWYIRRRIMMFEDKWKSEKKMD